jgi:hypothetical protein
MCNPGRAGSLVGSIDAACKSTGLLFSRGPGVLTHKRQALESRTPSSESCQRDADNVIPTCIKLATSQRDHSDSTRVCCSRVVFLNVGEDSPRKSALLRELGETLLRITYQGSAW